MIPTRRLPLDKGSIKELSASTLPLRVRTLPPSISCRGETKRTYRQRERALSSSPTPLTISSLFGPERSDPLSNAHWAQVPN
eukprot:3814271-Rhodomonas_salina.1